MKSIVVYQSKYGSTKAYAEWIAQALGCEAVERKKVKIEDLAEYDTIVYGGGLYAEVIAGVSLLTKNLDRLVGKKLIVYTTGITPLDCRDYYDKLVVEKNFKGDSYSRFKVFNFMGKMILSELSLVHRTALKTLKKIMSDKENPTEMEQLLITLCDCDGDFTDPTAIAELVAYAKE
ncbi:MAG: flavodoxin [Clostridia bacterium]|nr:flavodoxin [Clostridia bacterium]